jgi:hypothetical protein
MGGLITSINEELTFANDSKLQALLVANENNGNTWGTQLDHSR